MSTSATRITRGLASVPLWAKLTAAMLGLVTLALVVVGVTGTTVLDRYLVNRVDAQLADFNGTVQRQITSQQLGAFGQPSEQQIRLPSAYYVQLLNPAGAVTSTTGELPHGPSSAPRLPPLDLAEAGRRGAEPFTVASLSGERGAWRVVAQPIGTSGTLVTAASLDDVNETVGRLEAINVVVGLVVLVLLAMFAYFVVRASLRPLRNVEAAAAAFARGDLSQRIPDGPDGTEVGRLTNALNGMLAQIQTAFVEREKAATAARESEERMRRFVADASHELRTPLTSIRGFAELYRQGAVSDPESARAMMRRIEDEATRMGLLVEDLLLLARLDEQRPLARTEVDLLSIASDAVAVAKALDPGRRVTLELAAEPVEGADPEDPDAAGAVAPVVIGDDARLRQVVANLVSNALSHTGEGTPVTVRVGTTTLADGGNGEAESWAFVEVSDEGPGLSAEQRERVFERFYRAESSRARVGAKLSGSGLGLSIVAALVAAHGGRVEVTSEPGEGATFRVLLPRAGAGDVAAEPASARG